MLRIFIFAVIAAAIIATGTSAEESPPADEAAATTEATEIPATETETPATETTEAESAAETTEAEPATEPEPADTPAEETHEKSKHKKGKKSKEAKEAEDANANYRLYTGQIEFAVAMAKSAWKIHPNDSLLLSTQTTYYSLLLTYLGAKDKTKVSLKNALFLNWSKNKTDVQQAYKGDITKSSQRHLGSGIQYHPVNNIFITRTAILS